MRIRKISRKEPYTTTTEVQGPIRTCVGCRSRDSDSRLLRIVHDPESASLSPDPGRRAGGRGAWVHRSERCISTALDRRAFLRALRVAGNVSQDAVSEVLEEIRREHTELPRAALAGGRSRRTRNGPDTMSTP